MTETKTYSGTLSYHEMLKTAQGICPALTYVVCSLLMKAEPIHEGSLLCMSPAVKENDPFGCYFSRAVAQSSIAKFLEIVFHGLTVTVCRDDDYGCRQRLYAHKQFVDWLKTDMVTLHEDLMLVTVNLNAKG